MRSNIAWNLDQDFETEVNNNEHEESPEEITHVVFHDLILFQEVEK